MAILYLSKPGTGFASNATPCFHNCSKFVHPVSAPRHLERGFDLSHGFASYDAEILRAGAAAMFAKGAGGLLDEKLASLGVSAEQIEDLAEKGLLNGTLLRLAPDEMDYIKRRVQHIVENDPHARSALENEGYFTDYEQERTKND